jgi:riboflavin synthase
MRPGSSVAVNGVCLTVTRVSGGQFAADVMGETLAVTSLGALAPGSPVNLERPVRADGRLDGHLVQGHIDGTGTVVDRRSAENWDVLRIELGPGLQRYVVHKGSVAVDGVSLTVSDVSDSWFEVSLIPETLARTTLGVLAPGDPVNIEVDVLAKYVERLLGGSR